MHHKHHVLIFSSNCIHSNLRAWIILLRLTRTPTPYGKLHVGMAACGDAGGMEQYSSGSAAHRFGSDAHLRRS